MPGGPLSRTAFLDMSLLRPLDLASCGASPRMCTLSLQMQHHRSQVNCHTLWTKNTAASATSRPQSLLLCTIKLSSAILKVLHLLQRRHVPLAGNVQTIPFALDALLMRTRSPATGAAWR